jgi:hypothetical protein
MSNPALPILAPKVTGEIAVDGEVRVRHVKIRICELCLTGKGGECHVPGCALWLNRAPDLAIHPELYDLLDGVTSAGQHRYLVVVESPYAGTVELNLRYLRACMHDAATRGESPYASHALLTQPGVLRDENAEEREIGITAGFAWRAAADFTAIYTDLGWSSGMKRALKDCETRLLGYEERSLGAGWLEAQIEREKTGHAYNDWIRSLVEEPPR